MDLYIECGSGSGSTALVSMQQIIQTTIELSVPTHSRVKHAKKASLWRFRRSRKMFDCTNLMNLRIIPPPSNFIQQVLGHTKKKVEVYINLFTFQNNFTSYGTGTHPMSMLVLRIRIRIRGKRVWVLHSDMDPPHYWLLHRFDSGPTWRWPGSLVCWTMTEDPWSDWRWV